MLHANANPGGIREGKDEDQVAYPWSKSVYATNQVYMS